jgi:heterodisulfide reductase subunit B
MKYLYFPGCCMHGMGKPVGESILAVFQALDHPLEEIEDWNCCGATTYMSVDEMKCFALSARNLARALEQAKPKGAEPVHVVAPCSACYSLLLKTQHYIEENPDVGKIVKSALREVGLESERLHQRVRVRHPLDVLVNDLGLERIKEKVKNPLKGLKVASYYGCLLVRPYATFDSPHHPTSMDRLMQVLGAEPIDWPLKTRCCGGTLSSTIQGVGIRLSYIILKEAQKRKADLLINACPLCQFALECFQEEMKTRQDREIQMPVFYFTQLAGQALGLSEKELGLNRLFMPLPKIASAS